MASESAGSIGAAENPGGVGESDGAVASGQSHEKSSGSRRFVNRKTGGAKEPGKYSGKKAGRLEGGPAARNKAERNRLAKEARMVTVKGPFHAAGHFGGSLRYELGSGPSVYAGNERQLMMGGGVNSQPNTMAGPEAKFPETEHIIKKKRQRNRQRTGASFTRSTPNASEQMSQGPAVEAQCFVGMITVSDAGKAEAFGAAAAEGASVEPDVISLPDEQISDDNCGAEVSQITTLVAADSVPESREVIDSRVEKVMVAEAESTTIPTTICAKTEKETATKRGAGKPERSSMVADRGPSKPRLLNPYKEMDESASQNYSFTEETFRNFVVQLDKPKYIFGGRVGTVVRTHKGKEYIVAAVFESHRRGGGQPSSTSAATEATISGSCILRADASEAEIRAALLDAALCFEKIRAECFAKGSEEEEEQSPIVSAMSLPFLAARSIVPLKRKSERFVLANYLCTLCQHHINTIDHAVSHFEGAEHSEAATRRAVFSRLSQLLRCPDAQSLSMTGLLEEVYESARLSAEVERCVEELVQDLITFLKQEIHQECGLNLFGSFLVGNAHIESDLNLSLLFPSVFTRGQVLVKLHDALQNDHTGVLSGLTSLCRQYQRSDPSLSFVLPSGRVHHDRPFSVRISTDSARYLSTSRLVALYASFRKQFRILSLLFRLWAQQCYVDAVALGGLPKIAFDILLIYFLQTKELLPYVFTSEENGSSSNDKNPPRCRFQVEELFAEYGEDKGDWNLGELWIGLFRFYVIDRANGTLVQIRYKKGVNANNNTRFARKRIAVEDPFFPERIMQPSQHFADYFSNCFLATFMHFAVPKTPRGSIFPYSLKFREPSSKKGKKKSNGNDSEERKDKRADIRGGSADQRNEPFNVPGSRGLSHRKCDTENSSGTIVDCAAPGLNVPTTSRCESQEAGGCEKIEEIERVEERMAEKEHLVEVEEKCEEVKEGESHRVGCSHLLGGPSVALTSPHDQEKRENLGESEGNREIPDEVDGRSVVPLPDSKDDEGNMLEYYSNTFWKIEPTVLVSEEDLCFKNTSATGAASQKVDSQLIADGAAVLAETEKEETAHEPTAQCDNATNTEYRYSHSAMIDLKTNANVDSQLLQRLKELNVFCCRMPDIPSKVVEVKPASISEENPVTDAGNGNGKTAGGEFVLELGEFDDAEVCEKWVSMEPSDFSFTWDRLAFNNNMNPEEKCTSCGLAGHLLDGCPELQVPDPVPLEPLNSDQRSYIVHILNCMFDGLTMSPEYENAMDILRVELEDKLRRDYRPESRLSLFGSAGNGFGMVGSDADICLRFASDILPDEVDPAEVVKDLVPVVRRMRGVRAVSAIPHAKVPIVKFSWQYGDSFISADMCVYNVLALENTRLLRVYSELDHRVKILGICLKEWAKACCIGDASKGSLSSYSYIILLIHFLQRVQPPVLPFLQEDLGDDVERKIVEGCDVTFRNVSFRTWNCENVESLAELWIGYFDYFSRFDFANEVVQIRRVESLSKLDKGWQSKPVAIEDPFDLNHNLSAGVHSRTFAYIRKTFVHTRELFGRLVSPLRYSVSSRRFQFIVQGVIGRCRIGDGPPVERNCCLRCHQVGHYVDNCPLSRGPRPSNSQRATPQGPPPSVVQQRSKPVELRGKCAQRTRAPEVVPQRPAVSQRPPLVLQQRSARRKSPLRFSWTNEEDQPASREEPQQSVAVERPSDITADTERRYSWTKSLPISAEKPLIPKLKNAPASREEPQQSVAVERPSDITADTEHRYSWTKSLPVSAEEPLIPKLKNDAPAFREEPQQSVAAERSSNITTDPGLCWPSTEGLQLAAPKPLVPELSDVPASREEPQQSVTAERPSSTAAEMERRYSWTKALTVWAPEPLIPELTSSFQTMQLETSVNVPPSEDAAVVEVEELDEVLEDDASDPVDEMATGEVEEYVETSDGWGVPQGTPPWKKKNL